MRHVWKYYVRLVAGLFVLSIVGVFLGWKVLAIKGTLDVLDRALAVARSNVPEAILAIPFVLPLYFALFRYTYGRSVATELKVG